MNPYLIIGAIAGALVLSGASFGAAWNWRGALCEAAAAEKAADSQARKDNEAGKAHGAAAGLEKDNAESNKSDAAILRDLGPVVARPVYQRDCADADGLQLLRAAFTGAGAAAAQPHLPVPRPDTP
ncbi:MAG: hypothetical protein Q8K13_11795 [Parvibaculum sp.]|uniref:hypothetical protein n=1 Tax=Parvibaculum sp. TaxID=2024848 RepID=UPI0027311FA4|nr:hypothetical protein [Parvibaculum sp.]MDP2150313.1 hypothetical protein [Parvibaculum sp.]